MSARTDFAGRFLHAAMHLTRGLLGMPPPWRAWVIGLVIVNLVAPLVVFPGRLEARVVAATFVAGAILMTLLTMLSGFSRLLGLAHVFWFPLLYYLWTRTSVIETDSVYGIWLRTVIIADAISLMIDVTDVARYLAGQRADLLVP
jgi:hypothetical protein